MKTTSSAAFTTLIATMLASCSSGGGDSPSPPTPPSSPADTTAPATTLVTTPTALTNATTFTFAFGANEPSAYESRVDGAVFAAAVSPQTISGLADGSHTFEVRARDTAGNIDATPASFTWVIDTTRPDTTISAAPSSTDVVNVARFTATSTETGSIIEASVDGGDFSPVAIPYVVGTLADGPHTVQFRARDAANNVDASPATASWTLDATAPQVRLLFPSRKYYTDAATVSVRGTAQDPRGVIGVSVNGVVAQTTDGFAHWNAVIPVPVATTAVNVMSTDALGNTAGVDVASMFNRGPFIATARSVGFDAARNRVILHDQSTGNFIAISRSDGIGTILSAGPAQGTTPGTGINEIVIDAANDRALVIDSVDDNLVAINLATGARTIVSAGTGLTSPTRIQGTFCHTLDAANQIVYATVGLTASVIRINLANGARTIVSSNTVGTGESLANPYGIVYDNVTNPNVPRLLVAMVPAFTGSIILAIDLTTGNRTTFSSASVGTGDALANPLSMALDPVGQRVIVSDVSAGTLVGVSLATGNRSTITGGTAGTGPYMAFGIGFAFDPVSRIAFVPQTGGFGEVNTVTQVRRIVAQQDVGFSDRVSLPVALVIEQTSGTPTSLLYVQGVFGLIYRLDLASSNRSLVSWYGQVGSGPSLQNVVDMVLDRRPVANGRAALVLVGSPTPKLISVDLVTGNRTLIADIHAGVTDNAPQRMALDVANNRVLFVNNESLNTDVDEMYAIDLASGNLTTISDASKTGPIFAVPANMILEPAGNPTRAIIADSYSSPQILAIDLATGNRSTFDSSSSGSGVTYTRSGPMVVDAANSSILVNQVGYPSHIFRRPLGGGTREIVTGANPVGLAVRGTGPPVFWVTSMDVDFAAQVAYLASTNNGSIMAVDLVSGDRVVLAH